MKRSIKALFFTIAILLLTTGCKKLLTPNEDSKMLFGQWQYKFSYGGYFGIGDGTRFSSNNWVEFTDKGKFIVYNGSKKVRKRHFTIEMNGEDYEGNPRAAIVYKNGKILSFEINNDTLSIEEGGNDTFSYVFVKK